MTKQRVGIVTFWESDENYGQLAQACALQIFLEEKGYVPFLIKYNKQNSVLAGKPGKLQSLLNKDWNKLVDARSVISKVRDFIKRTSVQPDRKFNEFRKDFIRTHPHVYQNPEELIANPPEADIYITGSDQVWNYKYTGDPGPFFLQFGSENVKRIAYAASFGHRKLPPDIFNRYRKYLNSFDAISVREKSGIDLCKQMGYPMVNLLPDPTLLVDKERWLTYAKESNWVGDSGKGLNVLGYTIGNRSTPIKDDIIRYINYRAESNLVHVSINQDFSGNAYPTLPEWLDYFHKADLVVTNSYHGVLFSIIFNRNFMAIPCAGDKSGMNERLYTLLEKFDLTSNIIDRYDPILIEEFIQSEIDWESINLKVKNWRKEAENFISGLMVEA